MSEPVESSPACPARAVPGVLFGIVTLLLALGNCSIGLYPYGTAVWVRPLLSTVGIAGALLLLAGSAWWRVLLPIWCLLQVRVIATDVSGPWFYQGLMLGHFSSHNVKANQVMIAYGASGVNYAGLVLLVILAVVAALRLHPPIRFRITRKSLVGVPVIVLLVMVTMLWLNGWPAPSPAPGEITLEVDLPRVPIYYCDRLLGRTPLTITPQRVGEWNLPLQAGSQLKAYGTGWADALILSDGKTEVPLYAGTPPLFATYLDRFPTPWGERSRMQISHEGRDGRSLSGYIYRKPELRDEPLLTISLPDPPSVRAGQPLRVHVAINNPTDRAYAGREARITQHFFPHVAYARVSKPLPAGFRRELTMPISWKDLLPGATLSADLEFDTPPSPGSYEFFCTWFLYDPDPQKNTGVGSCYSNMLVLRVTSEQRK